MDNTTYNSELQLSDLVSLISRYLTITSLNDHDTNLKS